MTGLLPQQLHLSAALQQQHLEFLHGTASQLSCKRWGLRQQAAAVMPQAVAHSVIPLAEVAGLQQRL